MEIKTSVTVIQNEFPLKVTINNYENKWLTISYNVIVRSGWISKYSSFFYYWNETFVDREKCSLIFVFPQQYPFELNLTI